MAPLTKNVAGRIAAMAPPPPEEEKRFLVSAAAAGNNNIFKPTSSPSVVTMHTWEFWFSTYIFFSIQIIQVLLYAILEYTFSTAMDPIPCVPHQVRPA